MLFANRLFPGSYSCSIIHDVAGDFCTGKELYKYRTPPFSSCVTAFRYGVVYISSHTGFPMICKSVHCTLSHYPNTFFVSVGPRTHAACCCLELVLIWFWCGISSTYGRERESGSDLYYPPPPHPSWEGSVLR
jgi:hypothetical protein